MQINVAQLLQSPVGTTRYYQVDEAVDVAGDGKDGVVRGEERLVRKKKGWYAPHGVSWSDVHCILK